MDFKSASELIKRANTICLATHIRPDGDAIGSIGAMYHYLKDIGKEVYMVLPDAGQRFAFMPNIQDAITCVDKSSYDLLICLDCASKKRIDISEEDYNKAKEVLVIDHHKDTTVDANIALVDSEAPANTEIIYYFLKYMEANITVQIASYIYLGLLTDTGSFNYERTTAETYKIAGEMLQHGVDFASICKKVNDTYTEERMKLIAHLIQNTEKYLDGKLRIGSVDKEFVQKIGATDEDVDGLVNYIRAIQGTVVAVYIRPLKTGGYKISIRTEEPIDANELAKKFGGGGHIRASGFEIINVEQMKEE